MKSKIDTKEARFKAKELIEDGKSKQEVYQWLVDKYKYRKEIAEIVRYTPSIEKLKKYSIWNTIFLIYILLITLWLLLQPTVGITAAGGIIWLVLLIIIVALKKFKYYYLNTILGVTSIITILGLMLFYGMNDGFETTLTLLISFPFIGVFIFAGIMLPKKITPKYIEKKERYINKKGKESIRVIHMFE